MWSFIIGNWWLIPWFTPTQTTYHILCCLTFDNMVHGRSIVLQWRFRSFCLSCTTCSCWCLMRPVGTCGRNQIKIKIHWCSDWHIQILNVWLSGYGSCKLLLPCSNQNNQKNAHKITDNQCSERTQTLRNDIWRMVFIYPTSSITNLKSMISYNNNKNKGDKPPVVITTILTHFMYATCAYQLFQQSTNSAMMTCNYGVQYEAEHAISVSQDISVLDDVSFEASQWAAEQQSSGIDSHGLFVTLLWIIATSRLSHSEIILLTAGCRQSVETLTDGNGTCTVFLVSMKQMESAEFVCDFNTANVSEEGDTTQFTSAECS